MAIMQINGATQIDGPIDVGADAISGGAGTFSGDVVMAAKAVIGGSSVHASSVLVVGSTGEAQMTIASDTDNNSGDTDAFLRFTVNSLTAGALRGLMGYDEGVDRFVIGYNGNFAFGLDSSGNAEQRKLMTKYNDLATAGGGIPAVRANARQLAQTAAIASLAAYTVGASDGSFKVGGNVLVTTATSHSFSLQVTYTDESNTSRTMTIPMVPLSGVAVAAIVNGGGAGPYAGTEVQIRCKANTTITVKTTGTFTTVTYNAEGTITQVA